jgi:hypothetical protein
LNRSRGKGESETSFSEEGREDSKLLWDQKDISLVQRLKKQKTTQIFKKRRSLSLSLSLSLSPSMKMK